MYSSITFHFLYCGLFILLTVFCVTAVPILENDAADINSIFSRDNASVPNPLDYAPDMSGDEFPPYPSMSNSDGSNITAQNLRGVRLFGWKGCSTPDVKTISDAFDDFEKIATIEALYKNIDWTAQAATDIWGHGSGNKAVTDARKAQIQQIYAAAEQVRAKAWYVPPYDDFVPPWMAWRYLWIEIACSSVKGDPDNQCGDRPPKDPGCPGGRDPPPGGMNSEMEAFSNPLGRYSKITFCERFFNKMVSLSTVIDEGKAETDPSEKNDLWNYQNRARVVFHEITHLNYFMNAPDKSPYVDDLQVPFGPKARRTYKPGYGPENIKIIANYEAVNKGGFYTQRNADSYAWFAMAKYIQQEVGLYPSDPVISQKPAAAPRDGDKKEFATSSDTEDGNNGDENSLAPPVSNSTSTFNSNSTDFSADSDNHWIPGCPDHPQILSDTFGVDSVNISELTITCDKTQLSGVPYNVFHGEAGSVYDMFCFEIDSTVNQEWTVDATGKQQSGSSKRKRTPPPNPSTYDGYTFDLKWETNNQTQGCGQNADSCRDVYDAIQDSPCGHQAGEQNIMASSGQAVVNGCGTYSYSISSPKSTTTPTSSTTTPSSPSSTPDMNSPDCKTCGDDLGASSCAASDGQCLVDQCNNDKSCQACKIDCSQYK